MYRVSLVSASTPLARLGGSFSRSETNVQLLAALHDIAADRAAAETATAFAAHARVTARHQHHLHGRRHAHGALHILWAQAVATYSRACSCASDATWDEAALLSTVSEPSTSKVATSLNASSPPLAAPLAVPAASTAAPCTSLSFPDSSRSPLRATALVSPSSAVSPSPVAPSSLDSV
eukprot:CAMPEP_0198678216 /NCGR_PEP_ID=MMETSP1468-20131203/352_1 /TAXON_ID=1461545 /ORGANISM="Mantoniella sp, Strain CCMP1436" /LENGTH=177 /DNA_ID=CAMNT_0044415285 /DNA_START=790 /DNA_END=1320 /DNA_ORIENTATION=+